MYHHMFSPRNTADHSSEASRSSRYAVKKVSTSTLYNSWKLEQGTTWYDGIRCMFSQLLRQETKPRWAQCLSQTSNPRRRLWPRLVHLPLRVRSTPLNAAQRRAPVKRLTWTAALQTVSSYEISCYESSTCLGASGALWGTLRALPAWHQTPPHQSKCERAPPTPGKSEPLALMVSPFCMNTKGLPGSAGGGETNSF